MSRMRDSLVRLGEMASWTGREMADWSVSDGSGLSDDNCTVLGQHRLVPTVRTAKVADITPIRIWTSD